ncbi:MAG: hypothetical protein AAF702_16585 [Chloroflexota bacterium]
MVSHSKFMGIMILPILGIFLLFGFEVAHAQSTDDVEISKTASSESVKIGELITYTILIQNHSEISSTLSLTDTIPMYLTDIHTNTVGTAVSPTLPQLLAWTGEIEADESLVISYTARVDSAAQDVEEIVNQVVARDIQNGIEIEDDVAVAVMPVEDSVNITDDEIEITKHVSAKYVHPEDPITYTISIHNKSAMTATLNLTDTLDVKVTDVQPNTLGTSVHFRRPYILNWMGELSAESSKVISYTGKIVSTAQDGEEIINQVLMKEIQSGITKTAQIMVIVKLSHTYYLPFHQNFLIIPLPELANGGFEIRPNASWTEQSTNFDTVIVDRNTLLPDSPRMGNWAAWLGGRANETSSIRQNISVPKYLDRLKLRYYYWVASEESNCGDDRWFVQANNADLQPPAELCETNNTNAWRLGCIDMNNFDEQDVTIEFRAELDGSGNSNLYIDDVSIDDDCEENR